MTEKSLSRPKEGGWQDEKGLHATANNPRTANGPAFAGPSPRRGGGAWFNATGLGPVDLGARNVGVRGFKSHPLRVESLGRTRSRAAELLACTMTYFNSTEDGY